ncbi:MAG: hypothetical protein N2652_09590 [Kiritimatiellae bacterium]|nr:hypothetical protein [Kiritimatiellia bacterium]
MSIIQDALRRREEELRAASQAAAPADAQTQKKRAVSPALLVVMVVVLLLGGAFWYPRLRRPAATVARDAALSAAPARFGELESGTGEPAGRDPLATRAMAAAGTQAAAAVAGPRPAEPSGAAIGSPSSPSPTSVVTTAVAAAAPTAASATAEGEATTAAVEKAEAMVPPPPAWPKFQVKGVVVGRAGAGSVILDRGIVEVGQTTLDGVRVVRVEGEIAVMEFQGEERRFRIGTGSP